MPTKLTAKEAKKISNLAKDPQTIYTTLSYIRKLSNLGFLNVSIVLNESNVNNADGIVKELRALGYNAWINENWVDGVLIDIEWF